MLRLHKCKRCYSYSNPKRDCRCYESNPNKYPPDYCAIGFKLLKGIPQEPCYKPLTAKNEVEAKIWFTNNVRDRSKR